VRRTWFELLEERRGRQRHVDSELQRQLEQIALDGYKAGLLPEPFFEYPVRLANGRWRYPDVAYPPPVSVGFEAHSYEHHSSLEAFAADAERNLELFGEGVDDRPDHRRTGSGPPEAARADGPHRRCGAGPPRLGWRATGDRSGHARQGTG